MAGTSPARPSAGLRALWIQRSAAEPPDELRFGAERVVQALTDLSPLLGR
jgi:hypothetical protein